MTNKTHLAACITHPHHHFAGYFKVSNNFIIYLHVLTNKMKPLSKISSYNFHFQTLFLKVNPQIIPLISLCLLTVQLSLYRKVVF